MMKKRGPSIKDLNALFFRKFYFSQKVYNHFTKEGKSSRKILALSSLDFEYPDKNAEENLIWATLIATGRMALNFSKEHKLQLAMALKAGKELSEAFANAKANYQIYPAGKPRKHRNWFHRNIPLINFEKIQRDWTPIAERSIALSFSYETKDLPKHCTSCSYEIVKKLGGNDEDATIVAGLAGGIGLQGQICGAFVAKVWYEALCFLRQHPEEDKLPYTVQNEVFKKFLSITDGRYMCPDLSGRKFKSEEEHSTFIEDGGCNKLIDLLAQIEVKKKGES